MTARTGEQKGKCAMPCVGLCVVAAWLFCPVRRGSVGSTFHITTGLGAGLPYFGKLTLALCYALVLSYISYNH